MGTSTMLSCSVCPQLAAESRGAGCGWFPLAFQMGRGGYLRNNWMPRDSTSCSLAASGAHLLPAVLKEGVSQEGRAAGESSGASTKTPVQGTHGPSRCPSFQDYRAGCIPTPGAGWFCSHHHICSCSGGSSWSLAAAASLGAACPGQGVILSLCMGLLCPAAAALHECNESLQASRACSSTPGTVGTPLPGVGAPALSWGCCC